MNSASESFNPIAGFEPLLQAPARLQVMAVLAQAQEAEFARLREITGTSDSVMSKHLDALSEAGLISLRKAALDGRQRTWASLTRNGRRVFADHVAALQRIVAGG
ncbi:MAG TPA: transcriptional regulator [Sphingomonas sp.]